MLGAGLIKIVTPSRATIGQRVLYTVVTAVPPNVNFYDAAIIDRLPAGIDPSTLVTTNFVCLYPNATSCMDTLAGTGSALTRPRNPTDQPWWVGSAGR